MLGMTVLLSDRFAARAGGSRGWLVEGRQVLGADGSGGRDGAGEQVLRGHLLRAGAGLDRAVADAVDGEQRAVGQQVVYLDGVAVRGGRVVPGADEEDGVAGRGVPRAGVALGRPASPGRARQRQVGPGGAGVGGDGAVALPSELPVALG